MRGESGQSEQAETTEETPITPLRQLVIRTDGARMDIPFCNMGLWETKAILEEVLKITNAKLDEVKRAGETPQAPPAEPAENVVEEPAEDAV